MIRVELGEEIGNRGIFRYTILLENANKPVEKISTEPLLDACRHLKRMGENPDTRVGLFRKGRTTPDLYCSVGWGATHEINGTGVGFAKTSLERQGRRKS